MPNQGPVVPKFGDWDVDGERRGQQAFTVIFDNVRVEKGTKRVNPNDPEFLAEYFNSATSSSSSSSSSQAVVYDVDSLPPPPSLRESSPPPVKATSNQKNQAPLVPKFGDWDVDGEKRGQQAFTLIFDNMRTGKGTKRVNPNDPEFLAEYFNSSSSSSQAVVDDGSASPPPPSLHESPPPAHNPTSDQKNQIPRVPKFGEWNGDGENRGEQAFTLIFDNMRADKSMKKFNPNDPEFFAHLINSAASSSSSSQAAVPGVSQLPPSPLRQKSPQPPVKPTSRGSMHHKQQVVAPKFGDWDVEHRKEYTAVFDELKQEKRHRHASIHHESQTSTSPNSPLSTHKTFLMSWRQCFRSQAVRE